MLSFTVCFSAFCRYFFPITRLDPQVRALLIPLHYSNAGRWTIVCCKFQDRIIDYYDSLPNVGLQSCTITSANFGLISSCISTWIVFDRLYSCNMPTAASSYSKSKKVLFQPHSRHWLDINQCSRSPVQNTNSDHGDDNDGSPPRGAAASAETDQVSIFYVVVAGLALSSC